MPHIYIAGLFHETHTFLDETTSISDFQMRHGSQLLRCGGDSSPMGGAIDAFHSWGWTLTGGPDFRALPSGTVDDELVETFWTDFQTSWDPNVDAVFLILHGAMVSHSLLDVEGELLSRIRTLPNASGKPIFGVYDLHANFSQAMARQATALVAYRSNPHSDARDASVRAAQLLRRQLSSNLTPSISHRSAGLIWAPTATGTADDPMRSLEAMAREMEQTHESVWAANVTAGFAFADTPDTGVSFQIVTTDPDQAGALLAQFVARAREFGATASPIDRPIDEVMSQIARESVPGLTVLVEPSDNIGGARQGTPRVCFVR